MLANQLFNAYPTYKENSLTHRRFKHAQLEELINNISLNKETYGYSKEGRSITKLTYGNGPIPVMLWSQMHGDEATATMALLDIFNFLTSKNSEFADFKTLLAEKLTLHFIPMLNPDGAQRFQRRTSEDIDMNRDAQALQSPESRLLKKLQQETQADFAFNLHDQNTRYAAGETPNQAIMAFLATAYNEARDWNPKRTRAHQVITQINKVLQEYIPNQVGRFTDEFEPRAFGDNIMKWGSSLILIESGGLVNDPEKQKIRKLNFVAILTALESICTNSFAQNTLENYEAIPINSRTLFDLKIKNAKNQSGTTLDLGINVYEKNNATATDFTLSSVIEDMGDLSTFYGLKELDASGLTIRPVTDFNDLAENHKINQTNIRFEEAANFVLCKEDKPIILIKNGQTIEL